MPKTKVVIFWFRRDLRLNDNAGLYHALRSGYKVIPVFIFDTDILHKIESTKNAQVHFIHQSIRQLQQQLIELESSIEIYYSDTLSAFKQLLVKYDIQNVYTNTDYEAYATERDTKISALLNQHNCQLLSYKDQVIFHKNEILKADNTPYVVFTPYSKQWLAALTPFQLKPYPCKKYFVHFYKQSPQAIPSLKEIGFSECDIPFPSAEININLIQNYAATRDYPAQNATSLLGVHLRFGTISIRNLVSIAQQFSSVYLNELIWRDFYQTITWHFPHINNGKSFKAKYDNLAWSNDERKFAAWCKGETGYPIVDAGMRQLNAKGFMHNRVRMITASFLIKHLLIDWRWGEAYFASKLLDFDFAANNGGWQWAAGSGCDAAPYFRVFNPSLQTQKFDAQYEYIRRWVPEFGSQDYPLPIVIHDLARKQAIDAYKKALGQE